MKRTIQKTLTSLSMVALVATSSASASLIASTDNNLLYDDVSNITWLANVTHIKTSGYDKDGKVTLTEATNWAEDLDVFAQANWRLPSLNEALGLQQSLNDFSLFTHRLLDDDHIWTSSTKTTDSGLKSYFFTLGGDAKLILPKTSKRYAWAVFNGKFSQSTDNVDATIAEPTSMAIFSLALAGLVARRKQQSASLCKKT